MSNERVKYFQNGSIRVQEVEGGIKVTFIDGTISIEPRATNSVTLKEKK